jgi:hypothetical protein
VLSLKHVKAILPCRVRRTCRSQRVAHGDKLYNELPATGIGMEDLRAFAWASHFSWLSDGADCQARSLEPAPVSQEGDSVSGGAREDMSLN